MLSSSLMLVPEIVSFNTALVSVLFVRVSVLDVLIAPMSDRTSDVDRLSKPLDVKRAYSSSATEALSILTAFASPMPKVKLACAPISDKTSDADRPSTAVPFMRRKSSSTTPLVNVAILPLDMPLVGMSDVKAIVPALAGSVIVMSAVDAGPINVTALVPLSVSSLNRIDPAELEEPLRMGADKLLFVNV